jgi:hypothetical protein
MLLNIWNDTEGEGGVKFNHKKTVFNEEMANA